MANTYTTLGTLFTAIANAIRAKTGSTAAIKADDFPTAISNIPSGSTIYSEVINDNRSYWTDNLVITTSQPVTGAIITRESGNLNGSSTNIVFITCFRLPENIAYGHLTGTTTWMQQSIAPTISGNTITLPGYTIVGGYYYVFTYGGSWRITYW